jgi:hypothetical protein
MRFEEATKPLTVITSAQTWALVASGHYVLWFGYRERVAPPLRRGTFSRVAHRSTLSLTRKNGKLTMKITVIFVHWGREQWRCSLHPFSSTFKKGTDQKRKLFDTHEDFADISPHSIFLESLSAATRNSGLTMRLLDKASFQTLSYHSQCEAFSPEHAVPSSHLTDPFHSISISLHFKFYGTMEQGAACAFL